MKHIMVDLETLGIRPGCAVLSIGACVFDHDGVGDTFTVDLDIQEQTENLGLKIEGGTLEWWMAHGLHQHMARRMRVFTLDQGLLEFAQWVVSHRDGPCRYWANSPMFDFAILEALYRAVGARQFPWKFWELRDFRTTVHHLNITTQRLKNRVVAHRALQDAIDQAQLMVEGGFFDSYGEEG